MLPVSLHEIITPRALVLPHPGGGDRRAKDVGGVDSGILHGVWAYEGGMADP